MSALKFEQGDVCLKSWTCGYRKTSTAFAPEWTWTLTRWQKPNGQKYWTRECDWQRRDSGRAPTRFYKTTTALKKALRPDGKFLPTERCICNGKDGSDFVVVWKKRGESRAAALARGEEENRKREEHRAEARAEQASVQQRLGDDYGNTVQIYHDQSGQWTVQVKAPGNRVPLRFAATGQTLAEVAEALSLWTKGVVIV